MGPNVRVFVCVGRECEERREERRRKNKEKKKGKKGKKEGEIIIEN